MEDSIVRNNLMTCEGYSPYCGDELCKPRTTYSPERWPRTKFNGEQFVCPKCGWVSDMPEDFVKRYKERWGKHHFKTGAMEISSDEISNCTIHGVVNPVCHICDTPYSYIYTKDYYQKECDC